MSLLKSYTSLSPNKITKKTWFSICNYYAISCVLFEERLIIFFSRTQIAKVAKQEMQATSTNLKMYSRNCQLSTLKFLKGKGIYRGEITLKCVTWVEGLQRVWHSNDDKVNTYSWHCYNIDIIPGSSRITAAPYCFHKLNKSIVGNRKCDHLVSKGNSHHQPGE